MISRDASAGRALRAKRWSQESRQCARSARVQTFSVGACARGGESGAELWRLDSLAANHYAEAVASHARALEQRQAVRWLD